MATAIRMGRRVAGISRKRWFLRHMMSRRARSPGLCQVFLCPEPGGRKTKANWGYLKRGDKSDFAPASARRLWRTEPWDWDDGWWGPASSSSSSLGLRLRALSSGQFGLMSGFLPVEEQSDITLPCGLKQREVMDIMYRDIKPEDFEMLSKLDESLPKRDIVQKKSVEDLPKVSSENCASKECGVCLSAWGADEYVTQLPCQHVFHPACIGKWLTQCKNACPLCSTPIDGTSTA